MEELRPDVLGETIDPTNVESVDVKVVAPTEPLDDRCDEMECFEMNEIISGAGTGYDPVDPAEF